jgi:acetylornithine deacetylase/succinyl-diaminopimelate desuccinylase-like protein
MIAIDAARLHRRLDRLSRFGALPGGGVTRHCWSPPHEEARAWLLEEIRGAGLTAWVDGAGNVFGGTGIDGFGGGRPAVLTGSHIDTGRRRRRAGRWPSPLGATKKDAMAASSGRAPSVDYSTWRRFPRWPRWTARRS